DERRPRLRRAGRQLPGKRLRPPRHARQRLGVLRQPLRRLSRRADDRPRRSRQSRKLRGPRRRLEQHGSGLPQRYAAGRPDPLRSLEPRLPRDGRRAPRSSAMRLRDFLFLLAVAAIWLAPLALAAGDDFAAALPRGVTAVWELDKAFREAG